MTVRIYMKLTLLILMFIGCTHVTFANAQACGPRMTLKSLEQRLAQLVGLEEAFLAHSGALLKQAASQGSADYEKIINQQQVVSTLGDIASSMSAKLDKSLTIAMIRDGMVDSRDKTYVNKMLSTDATFTYKIAQNKRRYLEQWLTRISLPVVAIDAAKLRDFLDEILKAYADCKS